MGKARIKMSWEFLREFLQLPSGWTPDAIWIEQEQHPWTSEPVYTVHLSVEGENIESKEPPIDLEARFIEKVFDDRDGRWVQGHWEVFR